MRVREWTAIAVLAGSALVTGVTRASDVDEARARAYA